MKKSTFSPGVSFNTPMQTAVASFPGALAPATALTAAPGAFIRNVAASPQQYSLGIGGSLSSDANRIGIVSYYFSVQELLNDHRACALYRERGPDTEAAGSFLISDSDLKIGDWLEASTQLGRDVADVKYPTDANGPFKQNVISNHIKFEVVSSGNITPTWKLVRVSANPTGTLFNTQRDRTHDLLLTFGPTDSKTKQLATPAANTALAEQIGISVSNHIQINLGQ